MAGPARHQEVGRAYGLKLFAIGGDGKKSTLRAISIQASRGVSAGHAQAGDALGFPKSRVVSKSRQTKQVHKSSRHADGNTLRAKGRMKARQPPYWPGLP